MVRKGTLQAISSVPARQPKKKHPKLKISYRVLKPGDAEQAFKLVSEVSKEFLFPTYPGEGQVEFVARMKQIKFKLADANYISYVATEDEKIVGMVWGSVRDNYASLGLLFVDERCHRKGIGSGLIKRIEARFRKEISVVKLYSSIFALEFYRNVGYKKTTGLRSKKGIVYYPMKKTLS